MVKEDVVCSYNGILFSHGKEENPAFCDTQMGLDDIMPSEIIQAKTNAAFYSIICEI